MSWSKNDRKVQSKSGKTFPKTTVYAGAPFAAEIAEALRAEFGGSPSAVKTIGRLTARNERAVRNWFEGKNGPSAENLVTLIQHSDEVLNAVLRLAGRQELAMASDLSRLQEQMRAAVQAMDELGDGRWRR